MLLEIIMPLSFPKAQVLSACQQYGKMLNVPDGLDGSRVMAAIASNESSLGANCGPRHEPAYDVGGIYANGGNMPALLEEYGSDAACSYGPWQLMLDNCPGYTPTELKTSLEACALAFVAYFNSYVIRAKGAKTLSQIGQVFNGGHIMANIPEGVANYIRDLNAAYAAA
jgi:hypothetical protein